MFIALIITTNHQTSWYAMINIVTQDIGGIADKMGGNDIPVLIMFTFATTP